MRYQFQARQQQQRVEINRLRQANAAQQQSLTQLEQSHQLLNQVLDSLADGIAVFWAGRNQQGESEDFRWLMGNQVLADWMGRSPTDLAGSCAGEPSPLEVWLASALGPDLPTKLDLPGVLNG